MQITPSNGAVDAYRSVTHAPAPGLADRYAAPAAVTRADLGEVQISVEGQRRADALRRIDESATGSTLDTAAAERLVDHVRGGMVADPDTARAAQAANANATAVARLVG